MLAVAARGSGKASDMLLRTLAVGIVAVAVSGAGGAPILSEDFEAYTPPADPSGPGITVYTSSYTWTSAPVVGHTSQCFVVDAPKETFAGALYDVPATSSGRITFEVDVSFSGLIEGYAFQTAASTGAVWSRLLMEDNGELYAASLTPGDHFLGTYLPNDVFRLRVVQDLDAMVYWMTIDDELDGFADETPVGPLAPYNNPSGLSDVGGAALTMRIHTNSVREASVLYDNLAVWIPGSRDGRPGRGGRLWGGTAEAGVSRLASRPPGVGTTTASADCSGASDCAATGNPLSARLRRRLSREPEAPCDAAVRNRLGDRHPSHGLSDVVGDRVDSPRVGAHIGV
jgi:hypothetical protein